jgi:hypothetical protein
MFMRTHSQVITLRDVSDFHCFSKPPEDSQHPSPNPDRIARGSKGKDRAFLPKVIDEGPSGGDQEGDPDNPGDPGDDELPQDTPDNGNPEDLNNLTNDALIRRVLANLANLTPEPKSRN